MAFADLYDLPVYLLGDLPLRVRHCLVVRARRWRAVVNVVHPVEDDILLDAVVRIHRAGETSSVRIADLLQLPQPLVEHLQQRATSEQIRVSATGSLESARTRTAWVYRDLITGELWPDPAAETPPVPLRYVGPTESVLERGTAGRPIMIHCLLLPYGGHPGPTPSVLELSRFGRASREPGRRTSVVSEGEDCLIISPLRGTPSGPIAETSRGVLHLSLTRHLEKAAASESVAHWLSKVQTTDFGRVLPLRAAVVDLIAAVHYLREEPGEAAARAVLAHVELTLRRYCDQAWYMLGVDPSTLTESPQTPGLAAALRITEDEAGALLAGGTDTAGSAVAGLALHVRETPDPALDTARLARIASAAAPGRPKGHAAVGQLAKEMLALSEELLTVTEDIDGR